MQLKLSDISPGDIIEHESWGCNHGGVQERLTRRKGKVIQVTDKVITLQGKNYPETILVNDLLSGRAKILKVKMRGEDTMARYDWDTLWPQVQELQAEGKTIVAIAEEMNINLYALKSKLYRERQEEKQTLPPEPDQAANQEPEREEAESAGTSLTQEKPEFTVKDVNQKLQYELAQREQGYGPEDEEPIPYTVAASRTWTDEAKEQARKLKAEGLTMRQIAEEIGFTYRQVKGFFERERAKQRKPNQNDVLSKYKVKWIRDVMLDDLDPGVQLRIVAAVQGLEI